MPGGRPPKPTEQKRRLGNPGKRALPERQTGQPAAIGGIPAAPKGLRKHGKTAWQRYWSVGAPWLNATTDVEIVARLCHLYDEIELLRAEVKRYGHLVAQLMEEDEIEEPGQVVQLGVVKAEATESEEPIEPKPKRGRPKKRVKQLFGLKINPAVQALRKAQELATRLEGLCGFTPSDRSRLGLAEVKAESALDKLLARRAARDAAPTPTIVDVDATASE